MFLGENHRRKVLCTVQVQCKAQSYEYGNPFRYVLASSGSAEAVGILAVRAVLCGTCGQLQVPACHIQETTAPIN